MSKETKFTKGEWVNEVVDLPITESSMFDIIADNGGCIAVVYGHSDAHLIKTAPKLYAKLDELSALMVMLDEQTHANIELDAVKHDIDQLLAEARGEE